MLEEVLSS